MARLARATLLSSALATLLLAGSASADPPRPGATERITAAWDGGEGAGPHDFFGRSSTGNVAITPDGRFVAFDSRMTNLVPGDGNGQPDVFVHDRRTGQSRLVSIASDGTKANGASAYPDISHDGRYVVFDSDATNLVPGDTNERVDVFLHDLLTRTTTRVSLQADGSEATEDQDTPSISGDGRFVTFTGDASAARQDLCEEIFVRELATGSLEVLTVTPTGERSDGACLYGSFPDISYDGRFVAWESFAHDLVPGDTNGSWDIFVRDRQADVTERVSVATDGTQGNYVSYTPSISDDGRFVAFESASSNLVPADANWDTSNGGFDVFVRDRLLQRTERVSVMASGEESDRPDSVFSSISPDGRYVAFTSSSTDLAPGAANGLQQVLIHDRLAGITELVSSSGGGEEGNGASSFAKTPAVSADGRYVAFSSQASNLVPGDAQPEPEPEDVFVRDRGPQMGPGSVRAKRTGDSVTVDGWSTFSGVVIGEATDSATDSSPAAAGGEIVAARAIHRPELDDLVLALDLAALPSIRPPAPLGYVTPSLAVSPLRYSWTFSAGSTDFLVSGTVGVKPARQVGDFKLYRIGPSGREEVAVLGGSVGSAGEVVRVAVPLGLLETEAIGSLRATSLAEANSQTVHVVDEAEIGNVAIGTPTLGLALAPPDAAPAPEAFSAMAAGPFSRTLPAGSAEDVLWWRSCLGAACSTGWVPVEG